MLFFGFCMFTRDEVYTINNIIGPLLGDVDDSGLWLSYRPGYIGHRFAQLPQSGTQNLVSWVLIHFSNNAMVYQDPGRREYCVLVSNEGKVNTSWPAHTTL
jgi:hypothetical protein